MLAAFFHRNCDGDNCVSTVRWLTRSMACTILLFICCGKSTAQGPGQGPTARPADIDVATETPTGSVMGDYTVQQSVELGGRIEERTGNGGMYNTIIGLHSGPRLFDQSLLIKPMANKKGLFDELYEQSFGWGGDPSNALRLRAAKHGLYDFRFSFRRYQNYFDYNLLANPLNPTSTNPALPTIFVNTSPHLYNDDRRMYDYSLVLLPQKTVSFRFDYFRNTNEGPSFSTLHVGTEALLNQAFSTTNNTLRFGFSWRATQKTTLSFLESLQWIKNDTDYSLAPFIPIPSSAGFPVEYGVSWLGGSPCATPIIAGLANPLCSGYLSYTWTQRYRNYVPTSQVQLTSKDIRHVDFIGRFMYSNADANTPIAENFNGLDSRAATRVSTTNGTAAHSTWVTEEADAGLTIRMTSHLRFVDTFRFYAFRIPGELYLFQNNFFNLGTVTAPNILLPIAIPPAVPFHSTSSAADVVNDFYHRFVQQRIKSNESDLQIDFSKHFGVRAGFLYKNIFDSHDWVSTAVLNTYLPDPAGNSTATCLAAGGVVGAGGVCTVTGPFDSETERFPTINQYWGIAGLWYRMSEKFHMDAEVRFMSADDFLTRIDPRQEQQYRANASYTPLGWVTIGANVNIREQRNRTQDFGYNAHVRNFGINALAAQSKRISVDVAYNYTNAGQNANVCYVGAITAPGSTPCLSDPALLETLGFYSNKTHYGTANILFRPVSRVSALVGYSIIDTDGNTLSTILNPRQPLGSLSSRYQQPVASLSVGVTKQVELRAGWNYYQYNENSFAGPTLPRYFHANLVNLSLRYAF